MQQPPDTTGSFSPTFQECLAQFDNEAMVEPETELPKTHLGIIVFSTIIRTVALAGLAEGALLGFHEATKGTYAHEAVDPGSPYTIGFALFTGAISCAGGQFARFKEQNSEVQDNDPPVS